MKLPRGLSGEDLAYCVGTATRSVVRRAAIIRLTSSYKGETHHITIPRHGSLKVGTVSAILSDVATYLGIERDDIIHTLFGN